MSLGDVIHEFRISKNLSQKNLAQQIPIDPTVLSRIEKGERELPTSYDAAVAGLNWKLALAIADERTGGFISNILDDVPNLDLHPAALKDVLLKELEEAETALEGLVVAKHIDPEKRRESAERVWQEMRDVIEKAVVLQGVLEEEFGLDRKRLSQKHEMEVKRGER